MAVIYDNHCNTKCKLNYKILDANTTWKIQNTNCNIKAHMKIWNTRWQYKLIIQNNSLQHEILNDNTKFSLTIKKIVLGNTKWIMTIQNTAQQYKRPYYNKIKDNPTYYNNSIRTNYIRLQNITLQYKIFNGITK